MLKLNLFLSIFFLFFNSACEAYSYPEKYYQSEWCSRWNGKQEFRLPDKTRVDCVTKNYAVEFDFARKWAEAVGQSLYYAKMTGKKAAIILILENEKDFKYYNRAKILADDNNIRLWYMKSPGYNTHYINFR